MNNLRKNILISLGILLLGFIIGFIVSRVTIQDSEPKIEYIKGDTIYKEVPVPQPSSEETPSEPNIKYIYKESIHYTDTGSVKYREVDTLAILADWIKKRNYDISLFDNDTIGKLDLKASVQYNKISYLDYTYTPIYKVITKTKEKNFEIFGGFGTNTNSTVNGQIGFYRKHLGIGYVYSRDLHSSNDAHGISIYLKY